MSCLLLSTNISSSPLLRLKTHSLVIIKHNQSSTSIPWDLIADDSSQPTPPPQKRIKSAELYKRQHGLTDDQLVVRDHVSIQQHALRRERDKSKESRERDRSLEMKESLLSQALEGGPTLTIPTQVEFVLHDTFGCNLMNSLCPPVT